MGAQGTATLDFGAFPGKSDASITITGEASILSGSLVEAWIRPVATADHSADEHMLETMKVFAHTIVAGVGFTITGVNTSEIHETGHRGGRGTLIYGTWTIAWCWN